MPHSLLCLYQHTLLLALCVSRQEATYTVYPRIDTLVCSMVNNTVGPTGLKDGSSQTLHGAEGIAPVSFSHVLSSSESWPIPAGLCCHVQRLEKVLSAPTCRSASMMAASPVGEISARSVRHAAALSPDHCPGTCHRSGHKCCCSLHPALLHFFLRSLPSCAPNCLTCASPGLCCYLHIKHRASVASIVLQPLPDLSSWTFAGTSRPRGGGTLSNVWQSGVRVAEKVNSYTFFVTPGGLPVKLHMMGMNLVTGGSHVP